jgi:3-methyladenine DNA glycosylase/8-oxoguanine DNA glycosylase
VLCKSIFAQQISTKIANIMFKRFRGLFPRGQPTPQAVLRVLRDDAAAKTAGLSRQKRAYILDLARHFADNEIPTRKLARMSDEEVIECLTRVKGIGRWTAEMFLIFVLNRPDVWPVDDLGVREGARIAFKLKERPGAKELRELGERFRPHRTLLAWYMWRSLAIK